MTEFSSYATTNTIAATDSMLIVRAGVPYQFTGTMIVVDSGGNVGIGKTPTAALDVNGPIKPGTGTFSAGSGRFYTDATLGLVLNGGNGSSSDFNIASRAGQLLISNPANTETVIINGGNSGLLLVGTTTGSNHTIARGSAENDALLTITGAANPCATFYSGFTSTGANAAAAALKIGYNGTTSRSINAGGTVNVSGADYAEYVRKADGCGEIAKGDVCGVDRDGRLTRSWADAISFVVKSQEPGIVGGDDWAAHLGQAPERRKREGAAVFAKRHAAWMEKYEAARALVDRIAFCGRAPVNVDADTLAECEAALAAGGGVYLVAVANGGGIKAAAAIESDMTLPLYMRRLGKVWAIRDGRPIVDIQHG